MMLLMGPPLDVVSVALAGLATGLIARSLLVAVALTLAFALALLLSEVGTALEEHLQVVLHHERFLMQTLSVSRRKTFVAVAGIESEGLLESFHGQLALPILQVRLGFLEVCHRRQLFGWLRVEEAMSPTGAFLALVGVD